MEAKEKYKEAGESGGKSCLVSEPLEDVLEQIETILFVATHPVRRRSRLRWQRLHFLLFKTESPKMRKDSTKLKLKLVIWVDKWGR